MSEGPSFSADVLDDARHMLNYLKSARTSFDPPVIDNLLASETRIFVVLQFCIHCLHVSAEIIILTAKIQSMSSNIVIPFFHIH